MPYDSTPGDWVEPPLSEREYADIRNNTLISGSAGAGLTAGVSLMIANRRTRGWRYRFGKVLTGCSLLYGGIIGIGLLVLKLEHNEERARGLRN